MARRDNTRRADQIKLTQCRLNRRVCLDQARPEEAQVVLYRDNLLCIKLIPLDALPHLDQHVGMTEIIFDHLMP